MLVRWSATKRLEKCDAHAWKGGTFVLVENQVMLEFHISLLRAELDYQASRINGYPLLSVGSILDGDPCRWSYTPESSQMADLQAMCRIKRQNRGENGWGCIQGSDHDWGHLGFPTHTFQGSTGASFWNPNNLDFHAAERSDYIGWSGGRNVNQRHDFNADKNHLDTIRPSLLPGGVHASMDSFANANTERWGPCKRKSPMEGSMWLSGFGDAYGYVEREPSEGLALNLPMVSMRNAALYAGGNQVVPNRELHRLQQGVVISHPQPWSGDRIPANRANLPSQGSQTRRLSGSSSYLSRTNLRYQNSRYFRNLEQANLFQAHQEPIIRGNFLGGSQSIPPVNGTSSSLSLTPSQAVFERMSGSFSDCTDAIPQASCMWGNQSYGHYSNLASSSRSSEFMLFPPAMPTVSSTMMPGVPWVSAYENSYSASVPLHRPPVLPPLFGGGDTPSGQHNFAWAPFRAPQNFSAVGESHHRFPSHGFLDHSLVYNGFEIRDQHSDMRLDVDNMTYEELLALEERIGTVNTGLADDAIMKCLSIFNHASSNGGKVPHSQDSDVKCSICQEEYMEDDEIGQLKCGHSYHTACIKQWLVLKNQCPICKAAAYST